MIREPAAKKRESDRGRGMRFSLASCRRVLCPREWPPGDTGQRSEREVGRGALTVPRRKRCVSSEKEKPPRARIARSGDGSPSSDPTLGIDVDPPLIRAGTAHRKKVFLFFLNVRWPFLLCERSRTEALRRARNPMENKRRPIERPASRAKRAECRVNRRQRGGRRTAPLRSSL